MKTIKLSFALLLVSFLFASCEKGDTGPQGPAGANGTNGTNGTNGNANVALYTFGPYTLTNANSYVMIPLDSSITPNMIDSSLVLVWHQIASCGGTNWYASPGLGCAAYYNTRVYTYNPGSPPVTLVFEIEDPDGSYYSGASMTISKIKVIIAPANGYQGSIIPNPNDFESALEYYNLKDNQ